MVLSKEVVAERIQSAEARGVRLISHFTKMNDRHTFQCTQSDCLHEWSANFGSLHRQVTKCAVCVGNKLSEDDILFKLEELINRGILLISEFKGTNKSHRFLCLHTMCSHKWVNVFSHIYGRKQSCPRCSGKTLIERDLINRIYELITRDIFLTSEYTKSNNKHKFRCLKLDCYHSWETSFNSVYGGSGCARCAGKLRTDEEKKIAKAHLMLNKRFSSMFRRGQTASRVHHDDNIMSVLEPHWEKEYSLIPPKPDKGNWHLDHIVPVSWFSPYDVEQLKLCWHHKNVRWLPRKENESRGNKMRQQDLEVLTDWHYSTISQASYAKPMLSAVC